MEVWKELVVALKPVFRLVAIPLDCADKFSNFVFEEACLKKVLVAGVNVGIMIGASGVKVPQILKCQRARSMAGLSWAAVIVELVALSLQIAYFVRVGHPFRTWGECLFLEVQTLFLLGQFAAFAPSKFTGFLPTMLTVLLSAGFVFALPDEFVYIAALIPAPLSSGSRIPQIIQNFRQGHTGQLAFVTCMLNFLGNLARIATTLSEITDNAVLLAHASTAVVNGMLVLQIFMYWGASREAVKAKSA
jgi:mannose-P-dolichol utilization defect protein 1